MPEMEEEILKAAIKQVLIVFKMFEDAEVAKTIGTAYKSLYDGFIEAGFNEDQAIKLLTSMKIGSN
jgi:hypothetical protein